MSSRFAVTYSEERFVPGRHGIELPTGEPIQDGGIGGLQSSNRTLHGRPRRQATTIGPFNRSLFSMSVHVTSQQRPFSSPLFTLTQSFGQIRQTPDGPEGAYRNGQRLWLANEHHQLLAPGDASVKQIALQHQVVLCRQRDDHSWILRALAFMHRRCIGECHFIELPQIVSHRFAIKV